MTTAGISSESPFAIAAPAIPTLKPSKNRGQKTSMSKHKATICVIEKSHERPSACRHPQPIRKMHETMERHMFGMMYLKPRFVMNSSAPNHLTQIFEIGIKTAGVIIEQTTEKRRRSVKTCEASELSPSPKSDAILVVAESCKNEANDRPIVSKF